MQAKNGFLYYSQRLSYDWLWYFKPVGALEPAHLPGNKQRLLTLLDTPMLALELYQATVSRMANVETARAALLRAEAFHQKVSAPEWDPGGNTNNPGKVQRALKEAAGSADAVKAAERHLEAAIALAERLRANPFDVEAWRQRYLDDLQYGARTSRG